MILVKQRVKVGLQFLALILLDVLAYYAALFLAVFTRSNILSLFYRPIPPFIFSFTYFVSFWWIPLIFIIVIAFEKLYTIRRPFWEESKAIIKSTVLTLFFIFFLVSVRNIFGNVSRLTFIFLGVYLMLLLPLFRYWGKRLLNWMKIWKENVLVLGAGETAISTVKGLMNEKQLGYNVIGFLDDDDSQVREEITIHNKQYKIYGKIKSFTQFIKLLDVSTIIIALPHLSREELTLFTSTVQKYTKTVMVVPDLPGIAQLNTELHYLFMQKIFLLKINNNLQSWINRVIKRMFDIIISILFLPLLLPVIAVISIWIRLDSKGPAFIIQQRLGKNNIPFNCIKFRTMFENPDQMLDQYFRLHPEAEVEWQQYKKLKGFDPRVTRAGRFLRGLSLDELPQIINVILGDMSWIGPRPYLPREKEEISQFIDIILLTAPGITGLWQISGRNELLFEDRLKLDTWYIQNWSLWLDIIILFQTVGVVIQRKGAY